MRIPFLAALAASSLLAGCSSIVSRSGTPPPPAPVTTKSATTPVESVAPARPAPEPPAPAAKKPDSVLAAGVGAYDNGDYATARQKLQTVLDQAGSTTADKVTAHKVLAFMACADGKRSLCARHFRLALALDRNFNLTPAEAGHPVWGPVFKKVKAEKARKGTAKP